MGKRSHVRMKGKYESSHLDFIIFDLTLLESRLRLEQSHILAQLATRDATIASQLEEIERLRKDNSRLINRLKSITGNKDHSDDEVTVNNNSIQIKKREKANSKITQDILFEKMSFMTTLTSQFYEKTALVFTEGNHRPSSRSRQKPPIAVKPKMLRERLATRPMTAVVKSLNDQSNIVSTISKLLDKELDLGVIESSESSGLSSPESTLKPSTPKVIRIVRQYENGLSVNNGNDSEQSCDDQSIRTIFTDECEVTSGYNSDSISDFDHDYENVLFSKGKANRSVERDKGHENDFSLGAACENEEKVIYSNMVYGSRGENEVSSQRREERRRQPAKFHTQKNNALKSSNKSLRNTKENIPLVVNGSEESRLMDNFEEFSLDSLDLQDLREENNSETDDLPVIQFRRSGDGAETKEITSNEVKEYKFPHGMLGGYEKFLEVTGLSQKSILTPTRMFSNHRSVLKPRDVKHRDKLRAVITSLSPSDEPSTSSACLVKENSTSCVSTHLYSKEQYL